MLDLATRVFAIDVSGRDELLLPATGFGFPRKDATGLPVIRGYRILSQVAKAEWESSTKRSRRKRIEWLR